MAMLQVIAADRGQLKCRNVQLDQDQKAVYLAWTNSYSLENDRIKIQFIMLLLIFFGEKSYRFA